MICRHHHLTQSIEKEKYLKGLQARVRWKLAKSDTLLLVRDTHLFGTMSLLLYPVGYDNDDDGGYGEENVLDRRIKGY
ncbi:hypothetical protein Tco_1308353 [Tanacetum coccineum]